MSELSRGQKAFMIIMYILGALSLIVSCFVIYQISTIDKPWTIGVVYADKIEANDNQVNICTVNIKRNANKNGQDLYEMQWNSYTDSDGNGIAGFGIQVLGNWNIVNLDEHSPYYLSYEYLKEIEDKGYNSAIRQNASGILGNAYLYYTGDNGEVYYSLDSEDLDNYLLISINGQFYKLTLKNYSYETESDNFWDNLFGNLKVETTTYSWFELFDYIMQSAIQSSANGEYSEFPLSLFDISKYCYIEYKDDKGQYHELEDTTENRTYLTIQVNYDNDGATEVADSMFKQVAYSTTWDYYSSLELDDYWNAYSTFYLTEDYVNFVYDQTQDSYYITLDSKFSDYLSKSTDHKIVVNLNLDNLDMSIYGIDLQEFDFDITSFTINSSTLDDLVIYNQESCDIVPTLNLGGAV